MSQRLGINQISPFNRKSPEQKNTLEDVFGNKKINSAFYASFPLIDHAFEQKSTLDIINTFKDGVDEKKTRSFIRTLDSEVHFICGDCFSDKKQTKNKILEFINTLLMMINGLEKQNNQNVSEYYNFPKLIQIINECLDKFPNIINFKVGIKDKNLEIIYIKLIHIEDVEEELSSGYKDFDDFY